MNIAWNGASRSATAEVGLEGVDLAAERVAAYDDVEPADRLLVLDPTLDPVGEHDHPGAGAEHRQPVLGRLPQRVEEVEGAGQLRHRRRLAAGQHQSVDVRQLGRPAYGDGVGAQPAQHRRGARGRRPGGRARRCAGGLVTGPS